MHQTSSFFVHASLYCTATEVSRCAKPSSRSRSQKHQCTYSAVHVAFWILPYVHVTKKGGFITMCNFGTLRFLITFKSMTRTYSTETFLPVKHTDDRVIQTPSLCYSCRILFPQDEYFRLKWTGEAEKSPPSVKNYSGLKTVLATLDKEILKYTGDKNIVLY